MEALSALGLNPVNLLIHVVNFLLLLAVLRFTLYRPVLRMLDERAARVRESMERAEYIKREAERADQERAARLEEARRQAQQIVAQANQMAERILAERRAQAEAEAERIVARAREEAEAERRQALAELRAHVADLALLAAGQVIRQNLDTATNRRLVEEFLAGTVDGRHN
jgi:F-type H+-transporting ATPase subunit b